MYTVIKVALNLGEGAGLGPPSSYNSLPSSYNSLLSSYNNLLSSYNSLPSFYNSTWRGCIHELKL